MKLVQRAYDLGYYFSIPTIITRLLHFQEVVKHVSIDKILTETDAPYLSPFKFKRNEPSFIVETIKRIAELKNLDREETEKLIFMNYRRIFL
jgi:TatD DNase family protein